MAFTTLAERFEQRSREIYNKFSPSSDQLVVVKPDTDGVFGSRSRIKNDTRAVPTISVLRDTSRVSKFLASPEGRLFIGKQLLLQTGNTFVTTKIYNPLSPVANTVPFLHVRRHVPRSGAISGLLQTSTVNTQVDRFGATGSGSSVRSLIGRVGSAISTQLRNAANTVIPIPQQFTSSRPEYKVYEQTGPRLYPAQPLSERGIPNRQALSSVGSIKNFISQQARKRAAIAATNFLRRQIPRQIRNVVPIPTSVGDNPKAVQNFVDIAKQFRNNFYDKNTTRTRRFNSKYFDETIMVDNTGADEGIKLVPSGSTKLRDKFNDPSLTGLYKIREVPEFGRLPETTPSTTLTPIVVTGEQTKTDIITFRFNNGGTGIPFRAFISSIKESVKPEFNEQKYVGRTERFVTYGGAKRGVSLSFNIVAFSENEINTMWNRVNYLTGLAFPKGVSNGFMIPPLFNVTVGGIYDNQPCYIEALDYDFLDESITFDIDKEVPLVINVTMQLSLLEKRSRFYDSPFYKITEGQIESSTFQGTQV